MKDGGYVKIDHQASPGLPEDVALMLGVDPRLVREGAVMEAATFTCSHCTRVVIKTPDRERERATCVKCGNHFICDDCAFVARQPDYVHMSFAKRADTIQDLAAGNKIIPQPLLTLHK